MSIDDTLLMSYVDGKVSAAQRQEIEAAVAHSTDLAERLAALRASVLPYGAAFDRQKLPPVPDQLKAQISDLTRVTALSNSGAPSNVVALPTRQWPRYALAFAAGVFCFGIAVQQWPMLLSTHNPASLVQAVADYHALYARETVLGVTADPARDKATLASAQQLDGLPVRVPDLRSAGLEFKRVQRLRFEGQALIQIVYLPERGGPVALCITQEKGADLAPRNQQIGKVAAVTWRRDLQANVLVGADTQLDLGQLGVRIAKGELPVLYDRL